MHDKTVDQVEKFVDPILAENNMALVDIEYKKEGSNKILRLYIELLEGRISLDECADISKIISAKLDQEDMIKEQYVLEISSPGVNRVLKKEKDFIKFIGSKVDVSLYEAVQGYKKFTCILTDYADGEFTFTIDEESISVPADKVGKINLHFEF